MELLSLFSQIEAKFTEMNEEINQLKDKADTNEELEKKIKDLKADNEKLANIISIQQENLARTLLYKVFLLFIERNNFFNEIIQRTSESIVDQAKYKDEEVERILKVYSLFYFFEIFKRSFLYNRKLVNKTQI